MKKLLFALAAVALIAAADPTPQVTITMIGSNPVFADDGSLVSAPVQAMFSTSAMVDDQKLSAPSSISWDGTDQKKTVEFDGIKATYYQVTMLAATIAEQERVGQAATAKAASAAAALAAPPSP